MANKILSMQKKTTTAFLQETKSKTITSQMMKMMTLRRTRMMKMINMTILKLRTTF